MKNFSEATLSQTPRRSSLLLLACAGALELQGCEPKPDDTAAIGLPDETGTPPDPSETADLVLDTYAGGLTDETPEHTLTLDQAGVWSLTPRGGPWTALTGDLTITELLDGDLELPACEATFALTGEEAEPAGCDTCDAAFSILFYLSDGDPDACMDPDIPLDGETRIYGWSAVDETIYFNYYGSGVWVPWYEATLDEDTLTVAWTADLGVVVEEEDE